MAARAALLVATGTYDDDSFTALRAVANDAEDLRRVLEDPEIGDYEVQVLADPTRQQLAEALEDFFDGRAHDDTLLLYFSCHGVKGFRRDFHLAARDTKANRLASTAVSAEYIKQRIRESYAGAVLVLLDCCFSGAFLQDEVIKGVATDVDLDALPGSEDRPGKGTAVLTASTALEYAFTGGDPKDLSRPHSSYFTRAIVDALESGDASRDPGGWVSVDGLYNSVSQRVADFSSAQTPVKAVKEQGYIRVARKAPARGRGHGRSDYFGVGAVEQIALHVDGTPELFSVTFSTDSHVLAAGAEDAALLWELPLSVDQQPTYRLDHPNYVYSAVFSGDDDSVLVTTCEDGGVRFWDWRNQRLLHANLDAHKDSVYSIARSGDGGRLATGGYDGWVVLWDAAARTVADRRLAHGRVSSVSFERKGNLLAYGTHDDQVFLWDTEQNDVALLGQHQSSVECVTLSADGSLAASCGLDKRVTLWDVTTRTMKWSPRAVHSYVVKSVAFSPRGDAIASAGWDQAVYLWDVNRPGRRQKIPWDPRLVWHTDWIWSVTFSPDGTMLATAGADGLVSVLTFAAQALISD